MSNSPILEFDPALKAILEPSITRSITGMPAKGVLCFFSDVLQELAGEGKLVEIGHLKSEMGPNPLYVLEKDGQRLFVFHPGVGAPLAGAFMEELIAIGARQFIACGGCGVLKPEIAAENLVVIDSAVRDEGTSYHYLPPSRQVDASLRLTNLLAAVLKEENLPFHVAKTWTTDAIYRETPARRESRLADGCAVVEMEAAALFAIAQFRGVEIGQIVYGGDLVVPEGWDHRGWQGRTEARRSLFWLAVKAAGRM